MAGDFCKFFDGIMLKYVPRSNKKRIYYCESAMSKAEVILMFLHSLAISLNKISCTRHDIQVNLMLTA